MFGFEDIYDGSSANGKAAVSVLVDEEGLLGFNDFDSSFYFEKTEQ